MGGTKKKGVVGAASPWPDHSYNHQDHNQRAHAAAILSETVELKQIADRTQGLPPRDLFIRFMSSVEDLAVKVRDCESQSGQTEVLQQLHQIQNMLNKQTEEMKTLQQPLQSSKATNSPPASSPPSQAKSYRDAALASHLTSTKSSLVPGWMQGNTNGSIGTNETPSTSPSSPATPFPLKEDLEIHIQGTDHQIIDPMRHQKEARVVERANRAIKESNNAIIAHRSVSTGRILPSGDIILRTEGLEDVEQLARAAKDWCLSFGDKATIKRRTYRVVMNGVNCQLNLAAAPARIKADNLGRLASAPTAITYTGWLLGPRYIAEQKPETSKLIVEFDNDRAANIAILLGLAIDGRDHPCEYYDQTHRIQQCFNCQAYGHIARHCKRPTSCAYCAQNHSSQECPTARDRARAQCAVCQQQNTKRSEKISEDHFAFDRSCPARVERVEIARHNRATGRGWYESAPISLGSEPPSEEQSQDPTPAEATEQHVQRRGPGRPRKSNKRPRTEENLEPNSVMADAQPETETNTQSQTLQLREGPHQRPRAQTLSAPSNGNAPRVLRQTRNRCKSYTQHHGEESDNEQSQYHSTEDPMEEDCNQ